MPAKPTKTIRQLVQEYFEAHPNKDLPHGDVVDWVTEQWIAQQMAMNVEKPTPPRDPWRAIRKLHEEGWLIKVRKGVYRYDPGNAGNTELNDFTPEQKRQILERDGYRCVVCGRGIQDGVELHVDHIKPRHLGGKSEIENGQTLCAPCNLRKKIYKQTETGKRCSFGSMKSPRNAEMRKSPLSVKRYSDYTRSATLTTTSSGIHSLPPSYAAD